MSKSTAKVINKESQDILFECPIEEIESAYKQAAQYESMGLEVEVISTTITESLCNTLGIDHDEKAEYEQSVVAEIDDHDGSCCATPVTDKIQ